MRQPVVLAPMAGVTDKPFRRIVRSFGNQTLTTEMIGVESLRRNHPATRKMMDIRDETNIIVQLVGINRDAMVYAAQFAESIGAVGVDINMGCPVKKLIANGSGAALLKNPAVAARLAEAVSNAVSIPVSAKIRIGWDDENINAVSFAQTLEQAGIQKITVHGRTKEQGYSGCVRWDIIRAVRESVSVPVFVNGDVVDRASAEKALSVTGADGVMVGRGALGRPWILSEIEKGVSLTVPKAALICRHLDLLLEYYGTHGIFVARKHLAWYARGKKGVAEFCQSVYSEENVDRVKEMVCAFFRGEE